MIKDLMKRAGLLVFTLVLVGAAFVTLYQKTALAQGGFDYMCDAWEQTCDNGSGDWSGAGGGGGGGGTLWKCPDPLVCGNFGCHPRSIADPTQVCSRYKLDPDGPGSCPSPVNCTSH